MKEIRTVVDCSYSLYKYYNLNIYDIVKERRGKIYRCNFISTICDKLDSAHGMKLSFGKTSYGNVNDITNFLVLRLSDISYEKRLRKINKIKKTAEEFCDFLVDLINVKNRYVRYHEWIEDRDSKHYTKNILAYWDRTRIELCICYFSEKYNSFYRILTSSSKFITSIYLDKYNINIIGSAKKWKIIKLDNKAKKTIDDFLDFMIEKGKTLYKFK
jgi:hypothetical protein